MKKKQKAIVLIQMMLLSAVVLFIVCLGEATAKEYPERPITLIVPHPPGGSTDLGARTIARELEKRLKQPILVVNKPGGGTTIGGNIVATAKPDGYTLGFFSTSSGIPEAFSYFYQAQYTSKDLKPISCVSRAVITIVVKGDSPWNGLKEFVEYAKRNPDVKVATHGKHDLSLYLGPLGKTERINFISVPFGGSASIVPAVLGGHVQIGIPTYPAIKPMWEAKKAKILAVCLPRRADFAPEIPTVVELGYKLGHVAYEGLYGPKGLPEEIVRKLDNTVAAITQDPAFRSVWHGMGSVVSYENAATFERTQDWSRSNLQRLFKEAGFVKEK